LDTFHRPVDYLDRRESLFVPSARRPLGQCSMRRSLSRLPCRRHNGRSRAVVPNWHSRLTYATWAAPATALCALVTRNQQCNLANAASGFAPPTVLNTVGRRVFQGKPRGPARVPAPTDTWRLRTSPRRGVGSSLLRGPDSIWGPGPDGGPELPGRSGAPSYFG